MSIKKDGEKWLVDLRPSGRSGKRFRRKFDKKSEALAYEKHILSTHHNKEWLGLPDDKRLLSELIEIWWIKSGQLKRTASNYRKKLDLVCRELGNPPVNKINNAMVSNWQLNRMSKGQSANTVRRLTSCLSNVFTVLIETGDFNAPHPLKDLKQPAPNRSEMTYLTTYQIDALLSAVQSHPELSKIVDICLSTGSRWRETVTLKPMNLSPYRIRFTNTKTGKPRTVPISEELYKKLQTNVSGNLFSYDPQKELYEIMDSLEFNLPKGQKVHVLRHTFASHFIMNGGNILTLKEILGHASITQTMTYAHLAPDHLIDAVKLNPLSRLRDPQNDHTHDPTRPITI
ncbi:tyrosine-type recombinase/integrase [Vibrio lentus]|uniref:phage integrase n=1 Tax=Vibrio TaxID=662 RepID=UPI00030F674F|nr:MULTISPECIES: tyrosine-type recombinase/integrase [Vibrio]OCH47243.1 integrase [Vibrio lentus]OED68618.1 integrase [Vibrio tasmaniensis ZS-17]PMI58019.1 integrase [Vibrio lentus]PMJ09778.1 integrase [Vibrio lentus]TKG16201.1 integrase [Vibrio lentus]